MGWLGSVVFLGLAIGSITASFIYERYNSKRVLIIALLGNVFFLIVLSVTKIYALLVVCRFAMGFFQVFVSIYYPVWIEANGTSEK